MAQLTVRKVGDEVVGALKRRATAHGRSTEAEHRNILRTALLGAEEDFAPRAVTCGRALPERATGGPGTIPRRDSLPAVQEETSTLSALADHHTPGKSHQPATRSG